MALTSFIASESVVLPSAWPSATGILVFFINSGRFENGRYAGLFLSTGVVFTGALFL